MQQSGLFNFFQADQAFLEIFRLVDFHLGRLHLASKSLVVASFVPRESFPRAFSVSCGSYIGSKFLCSRFDLRYSTSRYLPSLRYFAQHGLYKPRVHKCTAYCGCTSNICFTLLIPQTRDFIYKLGFESNGHVISETFNLGAQTSQSRAIRTLARISISLPLFNTAARNN